MTASRREIAWPLFFFSVFLLTLPLLGWTLADGPIVDDNPLLFAAQLDSLAKLKFLLMPDVDVYWRPVGKLTVVPAATLCGYATWPHRLTIMLLHALATTLLFVLARRLINQRAALLAALIFLMHPVHAGTLHWLSARFDLVAAVLVLAGALCFVRFTFDGRRWSLLWMMLLTATACLSKEIAFVAPFLYASLTLFAPQRPPGKRLLGGLVLATASVAVVIVARLIVMDGFGGPERLHDPLLGVILSNLFRHVPRTLFAPLNRAAWPAGWADALQIPLLIAAGIFLFYQFLRRTNPAAWRGIAFGVTAALPMAPFLFLGPHLNAGYMLYLPSVGFAWWIGELVFGDTQVQVTPLWQRLKTIAVIVLTAMFLPLLIANLNAHHAASQTATDIVDNVRRAKIPPAADTVLFEDVPDRARGIRLFYDHIDQFFLPYPELVDKKLLLVGENFWRLAGKDLPWRNEQWRRRVAVYRWTGNGFADQTAATLDAWRVRTTNEETIAKPVFSGEIPPHVQSVPHGLQWKTGPLDAALTLPPSLAPPDTVQLRFCLTTNDPVAFKEAVLVWQNERREHRVLFRINDDDLPHTYTLPLAADPRWARTTAPASLRLHLPFQAGTIIFTE